jgi:hypothetical protein
MVRKKSTPEIGMLYVLSCDVIFFLENNRFLKTIDVG